MQFMETLSDAVDVSEFATFGSEFEKEDSEEMQWPDESVYEKSAYIKDDDGWLNDGDWDYKSDSEDNIGVLLRARIICFLLLSTILIQMYTVQIILGTSKKGMYSSVIYGNWHDFFCILRIR